MSARWKAHLVNAGLIAFTLWPLLHIGLTLRFDMSPWKLCGWGMYSEPRFGMLGMEVYGRPRGGGDEQRLDAPPPALQALATDYLERYRWLRGLASPDELARAVLQLHPEWDRVRVVVFRPLLDRASGMVVMSQAERAIPASSTVE
jgi:hypothetical protein